MKHPFDYRIFTDCGAPSLYNKLSRSKRSNHKGIMGVKFSERKFDDYSYTETPEYIEYRNAYIEFLKANKKHIDVFSNLDVINNPKLTLRNQKVIEAAGLKPIPVFHLGNDVKYLDAYIEKYDYIALGGLVPNPTKVLLPMLDKLFKEHILDKDGFPKVKVHGFACTALPLMIRYPWYSVDSATCRKLAMYGWIAFPEYSSPDLKTWQVSSRDIPLNKRLTPGRLREFERRAKRMGTTITELSDSIIQRCVWNYLTFAEQIQKFVPAWPWNYYTHKAKANADDYLTFYFAGSLSKKEEEIFWKTVYGKNITNLRGRLQSFFYKGNLEHIIHLKKKANGKNKA
jgi:hypothetical protein